MVEEQIEFEFAALFHSPNRQVKKRGNFKPNLFFDQMAYYFLALVFCFLANLGRFLWTQLPFYFKFLYQWDLRLNSWKNLYEILESANLWPIKILFLFLFAKLVLLIQFCVVWNWKEIKVQIKNSKVMSNLLNIAFLVIEVTIAWW